VFLCHNSEEKAAVKKVGELLKVRGLLPWLDEWELQPGIPWQPELEKQLKRSSQRQSSLVRTELVRGNGKN